MNLDNFIYKVCYAYKDKFTKWRTPEDHAKKIKAKPNYGLIPPNELKLETDFEREVNRQLMEHAAKLHEQKGIAYRLYDGGGKSFHLESDWQGLEKVEPEIRPKVKKALAEFATNAEHAKDFDEANFGNKRMWHLPDTPHRSSGKPKTLIRENKGTNILPQKIVDKIRKRNTWKPTQKNYPIHAPKRCMFLGWACENKLPISCRNQELVPNVVAYTQDRAVWQKCANVQGKQLLEFENWAERGTEFNCKQLQKYAGKIDKRSICDLCLLEGKKNG